MKIRHIAVAAALGLSCLAASAQQGSTTGSGPAPAMPAGAATPAMPPSGVSATQSATETSATTSKAQRMDKRDRDHDGKRSHRSRSGDKSKME